MTLQALLTLDSSEASCSKLSFLRAIFSLVVISFLLLKKMRFAETTSYPAKGGMTTFYKWLTVR
jgi:hypothetical protein